MPNMPLLAPSEGVPTYLALFVMPIMHLPYLLRQKGSQHIWHCTQCKLCFPLILPDSPVVSAYLALFTMPNLYFWIKVTPYICFDGPLDQSEALNLSSRPIGSPDFYCSLLCIQFWSESFCAYLALCTMPNMHLPSTSWFTSGASIFGIVYNAKYASA